MRQQPDMELRIAGMGPAERLLRRLARGLPNVRFEGLLDHDRIRSLFRSARVVIVPSLFPETSGMVAAEAMSLGTPVLARNRGSLPELVEATSGGLTYDHESELAGHMRRLASDDRLYHALSRAASTGVPSVWYEDAHTDYLQIIAETRAERGEEVVGHFEAPKLSIGFDLGRKVLPPVHDDLRDQFERLCGYCGCFRVFSRRARPNYDLRPSSEEIALRGQVSASWREAYRRYRDAPPLLTLY